jgi:tRNA-specific 2-thiouridylase
MHKSMQVIVGLSGGVDSSVAALLLKDEGHGVTGVTMRLWREGRYAGGVRDACFGAGEADDVEAAEAFCRRFGLPYHTFDCGEAFEQNIIANFRGEYLAGRTPNPCVRCNAQLKFGLLPDLARAAGLPFDRFATGHYARTDEADGRCRLLRARDTARDQSYFLYRLSQEQLRRQLFPLGGLTKPEVRALARRFGIAAAEKPDSQDFYSGDHAELIGAPDRPGSIVDETGLALGHHTGFWKFTIGQRKGLGIAHPHPLYVLRVDACRNEVVVGPAARVRSRALVAGDCHWVSIAPPSAPLEVQIKIRSTGEPVPGATLHPRGDGRIEARFGGEGLAGVAPGQSAVFYHNDVLLGGGIIEEAG